MMRRRFCTLFPIIISALGVTGSFVRPEKSAKIHFHFRYSIAEAKCSGDITQAPSVVTLAHSDHIEASGDHKDRDRFASCPTALSDLRPELWYKLCDVVDRTMEGLVSPAPESFHVVHSTLVVINSKISPREDPACGICDLRALSSFLVKPGFAIELYLDTELIKWRVIPRVTGELALTYPSECIREGTIELYHEHSTLQLSRMALDFATKTPGEPQSLTQMNLMAAQAERRLALTMGSDLRGSTSSDACLNFALAGLQNSCSLFESLCCIGIHELKRAGPRASFSAKNILHMVEKFAASDVSAQHSLSLYHIAGVCLEKKGYKDGTLLESLKNGSFGFHCDRPLLWLWRHSSRQKKVMVTEPTSKPNNMKLIDWEEVFGDTSKPLVVDIGSGMGVSLLNLSCLKSSKIANGVNELDNGTIQMAWSKMNYAGSDISQSMVNFGNGIISRSTSSQRRGRVHFICLSAHDFLRELRHYPGRLALIMINFPSPYRFQSNKTGNSQLSSKDSNRFMVTNKVLVSIGSLLSDNLIKDRKADGCLFLFQTKCEDVAVSVKNEILSLDTMDFIPCKCPVHDIELQYYKSGRKPKRVEEWLQTAPHAERAEGSIYSSTSLLPVSGRPETEVQCENENIVVHRFLLRGQD